MTRLVAQWMFALVAAGVVQAWAQTTPDVVAVVNGEQITRARFDEMWNALDEPVRARYETEGGGRPGYLETVIQRRLILQEALKRGYGKWPEIERKEEGERENALFDLFVREVIAPTVVTEEAMTRFYEDNAARFRRPELVRLRLIAVSTERRMPAEARQILQKITGELFALRPEMNRTGDAGLLARAFAAAAAEYSEHPSAEAGGDLGWVDPEKLEPTLGEAARHVPERMISGILETKGGYALLLVEKRTAAGAIEFESARDAIQRHLLERAGPAIVVAAAEHARVLRSRSEVKLFLENLDR